MIKKLLSEFDLYWEFVCTGKSNDKNKTNSSTSETFSLSVFFYYLFCEKLSVIALVDYFSLQNSRK